MDHFLVFPIIVYYVNSVLLIIACLSESKSVVTLSQICHLLSIDSDRRSSHVQK